MVFAPNFAIGMLVTFKLVDMASRALGPGYDVEVFEAHHKLKVDAPSGTALKLGEVAAAARGTTLAKEGVFARHGATGERKPGAIGFSVVRGGDIVGDHTVYFAGTGERIEITHRSIQPRDLCAGCDSRREVAPGTRARPLRHGRRSGAAGLSGPSARTCAAIRRKIPPPPP